jgi:hypothetical protein
MLWQLRSWPYPRKLHPGKNPGVRHAHALAVRLWQGLALAQHRGSHADDQAFMRDSAQHIDSGEWGAFARSVMIDGLLGQDVLPAETHGGKNVLCITACKTVEKDALIV